MSSKLLEEYLAGAHDAHRTALRLLHDTIASAVPQAELVTRRAVPAFRYRGRTLVSIGDARNHVSLYIMQGMTIVKHSEALRAFDTSRTVVRFDPLRIPTALIAKLARARMVEIDKILRDKKQSSASK